MGVINIPINIPDEIWANTLAKDYESKIVDMLTDEVRKCLADHDPYYNSRDSRRGIGGWVGEKIDDILKEYKDDIIDSAAEKLAERLARTKKAKGILEDNRRFENAYDFQPLTDYSNMTKEAKELIK